MRCMKRWLASLTKHEACTHRLCMAYWHCVAVRVINVLSILVRLIYLFMVGSVYASIEFV